MFKFHEFYILSRRAHVFTKSVFSAKVQCSNLTLALLKNYSIHILLEFLVFNAIRVTKTVLVLFSTFSSAN